jgi:hypothetical protein
MPKSILDPYASKWLKAEDLQGKPWQLMIDQVTFEEVGGDDEEKRIQTVLYFRKTDKRLGLNVTNAKSVEEVCGTADPEHLPGRTIEIYPTTTRFGKKTVPCIRVRAPGTKGQDQPRMSDEEEALYREAREREEAEQLEAQRQQESEPDVPF